MGTGLIHNIAHLTQVRDFTNLQRGSIYPTDIDGLIEYHGLGYVFIETKWRMAKLPLGQRLALERLCDDLQRVKPTLLLVAEHNTAGNIDVANTLVREYRWRGRWHETTEPTTTKRMVFKFLAWVEVQQQESQNGK